MNEEGFFDADARSNLAHGDASGVRIFAIGTNYDAFKNLRTKLFTFLNLLGNANSIARADVNHSGLFLSVTNLLQIYKTHNLTFILQLSLFYHSFRILRRGKTENYFCLRAWRTRSSTDKLGSMPERAAVASLSGNPSAINASSASSSELLGAARSIPLRP